MKSLPPDDGYRVLVDRLWPRGVSKDKAHLDEWAKDLAPSTELAEILGINQRILNPQTTLSERA